jgi:hypothetical protein
MEDICLLYFSVGVQTLATYASKIVQNIPRDVFE